MRPEDVIEVNYDRELVRLPDGGQMSIDWVYPDETKDKSQLIIIWPGLTGGSDRGYIKCLANHLQNEGFLVGVL